MPIAVENLRKSITLNSGAEYFIDKKALSPRAVKAGRTRYAIIRMKIFGRGYRTVRKAVIIKIENFDLEDAAEPDRLFVSNSPELLKSSGTLLKGSIEQREGARYLMHHKNGMNAPLNFVFKVSNPGEEPVSLLIIDGTPKKGLQEMSVGHGAASEFLENSVDGLGRIIEIPPQGDFTIHRIKMHPQEILSGIGELRLLSGKSVNLEMAASRQFGNETVAAAKPDPREARRGHGVFGPPFVHIEDRFEVGGRWKFIGIGDQPLKNLVDGSVDLMGNYGVTHRVKVDVWNPSDQNEKVQVHFSPVSGPAGGTIIVDGQIVKLGVCKPPKTEPVKVFWMKPREARKVEIEMIPESGAFYPVRIVFMARKLS